MNISIYEDIIKITRGELINLFHPSISTAALLSRKS